MGYDRQTVENKTHEEIADLWNKLDVHLVARYRTVEQMPHGQDRVEYGERLTRIATREKLLGGQ